MAFLQSAVLNTQITQSYKTGL